MCVVFFFISDKFLQQISFLLDMRNEKASVRRVEERKSQGLRSVCGGREWESNEQTRENNERKLCEGNRSRCMLVCSYVKEDESFKTLFIWLWTFMQLKWWMGNLIIIIIVVHGAGHGFIKTESSQFLFSCETVSAHHHKLRIKLHTRNSSTKETSKN